MRKQSLYIISMAAVAMCLLLTAAPSMAPRGCSEGLGAAELGRTGDWPARRKKPCVGPG